MLYNIVMENKGEIIIYSSGKDKVELEVKMIDENIWLSQEKIAELFNIDRTVIGRHISNIYKTDELAEKSTCAFFAHVGERRKGRTY